ncbi:hypothetical protein QBC36DRAFT_386609 [Triangularia setosa]|uniref:5'-3' DNA helicase ZGRF1-like N-terminal domain-containing protein n=1 Tax=Triangularia setosa TaxID=2587417 RepID=A0AAN7A910_9PEZI|nr:hypothetical protein QBC36DRAFT_386609 [Podospora setosa]
MPAITSSGARPELAGGGSSAPVLEFLCLFTHDLQRKQKRWQDGRLKYHTFNKRVMVYDDRGNSVGDMHWQRDWEFDEGEEIKLDRGGVIVQVQECVGRQNQDLSDLLDKRAKEKEERQSRTAVRMAPVAFGLRTPAVSSRVYPAQIVGPGSHHRRLDQVLTPTGHHGRAVVPTESPFEQRQRDQETPGSNKEAAPSSKRRKYDDTPPSKLGYAQSLFGAPLTLSAVPMSSAPARRPTASAARMHSEPASSPEEGTQVTEFREQESNVSKRRKRDDMPPSKMGYSQSLFGASLNLSAAPMSSASIPRRTTSAARVPTELPSFQEDGPRRKETVDDVQEIPVNLSVRTGLSRATATAPLLKTCLPPLGSAPKPGAQNKASRPRTRQREVAVEAQTDDAGTNSGSEDDAVSTTRNRTTAELIGKDHNCDQKAAPKPKESAPLVILDGDAEEEEEGGGSLNHGKNRAHLRDNDPDEENHEIAMNLPPKRSKMPAPKTTVPKAAPATKQPKTSKSTKNNKTTKAQNAGSKTPVEEERETTGVGLCEPPEGPRAQLRIQPRQKRGLLVSSEKGNKPKKPKVRHAELRAESVYNTKPLVPNPAPITISEEDDPFASFVDPVQEPVTIHKPKNPPRQREAHNNLGARNGILVSSQTINGNQLSNVRANDGPMLDSENSGSVPTPAALDTTMTGANDEVPGGPQGTARASKRSPGQQKTAGLVEATTRDQGSTVQSSDSPQALPAPSTQPSNSPKHLQDNITDAEDLAKRPRARQTRKRAALALDESQDEGPPTRKTKKRMAMVSDESDEKGPLTRHSTSRDTSVSYESDGEKRRTRQSKRRTAKAFAESDDEGPPNRQTRRREKAAMAEESDSDELPQVPVGPRLARLRKSVKSREVIGFVPSSSPVMETVTMAEPRPLPIPIPLPAPSPAPSPAPNLMDTRPGLDITDISPLINANNPKVTAPGADVSKRELVLMPVVHNLSASKALATFPPLKSTRDIASAVRRDNLRPAITSGGAPANKPVQDPAPVHLEQSICDSPSGKPPHYHVASASGADKAGQSAAAHQQTMSSLNTNLSFLSAVSLSDKGPSLIRKEVEGASRSHEAVSHPEVHEDPIAVPRDVGVSSVASNNPNGQAPKVPSAADTRPKIANPATRGRKAALKSHAAGQVPQSILPLEPAPVRLTVRPPETIRPEAAAGGRPKFKMQLPGFTSAKETARDSAGDVGPWSREAHDLFGSGRPSA